TLEQSRILHVHLAPRGLFGRRPEHREAAGELVGARQQPGEGPDRRRRDEIVPACLAEPRDRVVLRHGRHVGARAAGVEGDAERGLEAADALLDAHLVAELPRVTEDRRDGPMLLPTEIVVLPYGVAELA